MGELNWTTYPSAPEAARQLKLHKFVVRHDTLKKTDGFEFEFDTPNEPEILDGEVWRDVVLLC